METRRQGSARRGLTGLALALLFGSAAACGSAPPADAEARGAKASSIFFENSNRRDASPQEAARVARVGGCTAFFIENTAKKVYLGTARHCFDYDVTSWCQNDGVIQDNAGNQGRCTRVVAGDRAHDITVIEGDIPHASSGDTTLRLGKFLAPVRTLLLMTGYPGDQDPQNPRNGALTTTENCWTLSGVAPNQHAHGAGGPTDPWQMHNCSTYGGNSGGPMYIQGTRTVIGLPAIYLPDDYRRLSAHDVTTAAGLDLMQGFVSVHEAALTAAGIRIDASLAAAYEPTPEPEADLSPEEEPVLDEEELSPDEEEEGDELPSDEADDAPKKKKSKKKAPAARTPAAGRGCTAAAGSGAPSGDLVALAVALGLLAARLRKVRSVERRPGSGHLRAWM